MNQFEKNNPEILQEFLRQLNDLVDEFHPNIYTIDKVFNGLEMIEIGIKEQLNKQSQSTSYINGIRYERYENKNRRIKRSNW